jgi:3-deoxy-7-phosphoheptulonate synthase
MTRIQHPDTDTSSPFPLAERRGRATVVEIGSVRIGGPDLVLVAGPCSVESESQLRETAFAARAAGATILRGGAFKPRTSPYAFQGLGETGLALLRRIGDETGMAVVTEALDPTQVPLVAAYADAIQIGSRNMHVAPLLRAAGASGLPVLLKRGMSATLEEFLLAAETVLLEGNTGVVLCERGIRTFDTYTRNCLDVGGIAALKRLTHLPVLADPSHATGRRELVVDTALGAVAAGADGLVVEAHADPASALSDADQQLPPEELAELAERVRRVAQAVGRSFGGAPPNGAADGPTADFVRRLREEISENDRGIVEAINARLELVTRMQRYKAEHGIAFHDPSRERSLVRSLQETNEGPLSPEGLEEILLALLDLTKREVA